MANPFDDSQQSRSPQGHADPWFRLLLVMAIPVLLLLVVISFSR
jgi:hypothetical protein